MIQIGASKRISLNLELIVWSKVRIRGQQANWASIHIYRNVHCDNCSIHHLTRTRLLMKHLCSVITSPWWTHRMSNDNNNSNQLSRLSIIHIRPTTRICIFSFYLRNFDSSVATIVIISWVSFTHSFCDASVWMKSACTSINVNERPHRLQHTST